MGNVDVIGEIFESFELIRKHYMEVIVPVILLLLIYAGARGSSIFSGMSGGSHQSSSFLSGAMLANAAYADPSTLLLALGGLVLVALALLVLLVIIFVILEKTLWFYVWEHFYAIICKKKIKQTWQQRCKRLAIKAVVVEAFWLLVCLVLFAVPSSMAWDAVSHLQQPTFAGFISALGPAALALIAALLVLVVAGFLLTPLWVFYAMDGLGFFESASRSLSLVGGNLITFLLLGIIFGLLGIGSALASATALCFSFIVSPILTVFIGLLWGVTLMKVKLALEEK